jgi:hypothetical protein
VNLSVTEETDRLSLFASVLDRLRLHRLKLVETDRSAGSDPV